MYFRCCIWILRGPACPSSEGNRYVIALTDNLSKYVIAKAVPNNTAKTAADFLMKEFIMIHGTPERLITNNGVHFSNDLMKSITTTLRINHTFSASYHPQTNGQIERFNATFCAQLAKYYDENSDDWDKYLDSVIYAYNTGVHATTGCVPYELEFARKQRSPFDPTSKRITRKHPDSFYKHLQKTRQVLVTQAKENIQYQHQLSQARYNKHRKDIHYSAGDLVFVKICANRTKLDERWTGPCRVIRSKGEQNYLLEDTESGKTDWAHVSQLQPVIHRNLT
jgi:hypothetical protein